MSRFAIRLIIALLTFMIGICVAGVWVFRDPQIEPVLQKNGTAPVMPRAMPPGFLIEINDRTHAANLPDLRTVTLPAEDLEVRIWRGFGVTLLRGFIIKRSAGHWSAAHLAAMDPRFPRSKYPNQLQPPQSGWEECWKHLVEAGILTLPDASQLGEEPNDPDVESYVVEYKVDGKYRTYHYTYPEANDRPEAKQMMQIGEIIFEEFGLAGFRTNP